MHINHPPSWLRRSLRYPLALALVLRTCILAPFRPGYRKVLYALLRQSRIGQWLDDIEPEWQPSIPAVNPYEWTGINDIRLPFEPFTDGNVDARELQVLAALARHGQPQRIFEIGTFNGLTTLTFALNTPPEAEVLTLDLPPGGAAHTRFDVAEGDRKFIATNPRTRLFERGRFPEENKITQLFGDSAAFDFAPYRHQIDCVFVDGSHAYDYVINDSRTALELLRPEGGVIVWHDYGPVWPDVIRALEELHGSPDFSNLRHIQGTTFVILDRR